MSVDPNTQILPILAKLVSIPSVYPPGDTGEIATYLDETLRALGFSSHIYQVQDGPHNVIARIGSGRPSLVLNAHVDTVDVGDLTHWSRPPFELTVDGGRAYGLGAANCKGSAAVQLWLAEQIARRGGPARGEIVFTFVGDEESLGPKGMSALRELGIVEPDMLLLGAPTENSLITTERGVLWAELTTTGLSAHAGEPERGDNAIMRMLRILRHVDEELSSRLRIRHGGGMRSTYNIGKIAGGRNTNVVPSMCTAQIDRRLLPTETVVEAFAELQSIVQSTNEPRDSVSLRQLCGTNGFIASEEKLLVRALREAITHVTGRDAQFSQAIGVSDGRYFADDGIEIVNFGPGEGEQGHASNESVNLDSLRASALILERTVTELLGTRRPAPATEG